MGGAGLAALAVVWARLSQPPTPDVAWLLYAAGVLRDGGVLGTDVVENSPPIIFWLKIPVLVIGGALGLAAWPSWIAALLLVSLASALLTHRLSKGMTRGRHLGLLAGAVFLLLPGREFGQREHVALILTVPWLIVIARRLEGRPARGPACWVAITFAAVGLGIKPHFGLVWLAAAGLLVSRLRSIRVLWRPELAGVALLLVLEVAAVAFIYPSYLEHLRLYGRAYVGFLAIPLWQALLVGAGPAAVLFAVLARVAFRGGRERTAQGSAALLAGAIGFWLAAALQQKGWSYHYLPAQGVALLAIGALLAETPVVVGLAGRIYRAAAVGVLAMTLLTPAVHSVLQVVRIEAPDRRGLDPNLEALVPVVRAAGREGSVFVFSTNIASSFPLVSEAGTRWAFRHPSLLMLGAAYSEQLDGIGMVRTRPLAERTPAERRFGAELLEDFQRYRPVLLLVVREDVRNPGWGGAKQFDYLGYFGADPAFVEEFKAFTPVGDIGDYLLLVRRDAEISLPRTAPAPVVRRRTTVPIDGSRTRWEIDPLGLVVFGLVFGASWLRSGEAATGAGGGWPS